MKKSYIYPTVETHVSEVEQMMALSLREENATSDDALVKASNWDVWSDVDETED